MNAAITFPLLATFAMISGCTHTAPSVSMNDKRQLTSRFSGAFTPTPNGNIADQYRVNCGQNFNSSIISRIDIWFDTDGLWRFINVCQDPQRPNPAACPDFISVLDDDGNVQKRNELYASLGNDWTRVTDEDVQDFGESFKFDASDGDKFTLMCRALEDGVFLVQVTPSGTNTYDVGACRVTITFADSPFQHRER